MPPTLLLDCYLDDVGCARHFAPWLGDDVATFRPAHEDAPTTADGYGAVVLTGSAASALDESPWSLALEALVRGAVRADVPVLGICYGHQLVAKALFGDDAVRPSPTPELGWFEVEVAPGDPVLDAFAPGLRTFCSHFDEVTPDTAGLEVRGSSPRCAVQAYRVTGARAWGVQFHAEMDFEESERLLRARATEHPELGVDVAGELAERVDTGARRDDLLTRFLAVARGGDSGGVRTAPAATSG